MSTKTINFDPTKNTLSEAFGLGSPEELADILSKMDRSDPKEDHKAHKYLMIVSLVAFLDSLKSYDSEDLDKVFSAFMSEFLFQTGMVTKDSNSFFETIDAITECFKNSSVEQMQKFIGVYTTLMKNSDYGETIKKAKEKMESMSNRSDDSEDSIDYSSELGKTFSSFNK